MVWNITWQTSLSYASENQFRKAACAFSPTTCSTRQTLFLSTRNKRLGSFWDYQTSPHFALPSGYRIQSSTISSRKKLFLENRELNWRMFWFNVYSDLIIIPTNLRQGRERRFSPEPQNSVQPSSSTTWHGIDSIHDFFYCYSKQRSF